MELLYKEICLFKKQLKQNALSILAIVGLTVYFKSKNNPPSQFIFTLPMLICMLFLIQGVNASINSERKNKTLEKMLTVYSIDQIMLPKILFNTAIVYVIAMVYSIIARIYFSNEGSYVFDTKVMLIELVILAIFASTTAIVFATVYITINNQTVLSIVSIALTLSMVMFSMKIQAGVISPLYLVLAVIAVIVLYVIVLKILSKLNKDYLLKD